jgi:hypothetical protein
MLQFKSTHAYCCDPCHAAHTSIPLCTTHISLGDDCSNEQRLGGVTECDAWDRKHWGPGPAATVHCMAEP